MATRKARSDESKGVKAYWNSPAGKARRRSMSSEMRGKTRTRRVRTMARKRTHRKKKMVVHVIPDGLAIAATALPLTFKDPNGFSFVDDVKSVIGGDLSAVNNMPYHLMLGFKSEIVPMAGLGIGALVVRWAGRKLGLNRIGTKDFKVA